MESHVPLLRRGLRAGRVQGGAAGEWAGRGVAPLCAAGARARSAGLLVLSPVSNRQL